MNGLQPGHHLGRTVAGTTSQVDNDCSAAAPMEEGADDSQLVIGVPSMVGVPVHSKDQDARRAFQYQYSVASAWWQRWHQWHAKTYTASAPPPQPYEANTTKIAHPPMMPSAQMGLPAMVKHPPGTASEGAGSMHTAPMPASDGCTKDEGVQAHSTVSSDVGKSSLLKGIGEHKVCKNCGTDCTPFWRKDKNDQLPLCNACGLYAAKNGSMRPANLWRQEEGLSPVPRPTTEDTAVNTPRQGPSPASAPLPSLHASDPVSAVSSEALSDPLHPATCVDGAAATLQHAAGDSNPSLSDPASNAACDAEAPAATAGAAASASGSTAPSTVPMCPPPHASQSAQPSSSAEAGGKNDSLLPPLKKPPADMPALDNAKEMVSNASPLPSAAQPVPVLGPNAEGAVAGHPVPDAPTIAPMPGSMVPPAHAMLRVPAPAGPTDQASCFGNEGAMQLPSAAELLSGGLHPAGGSMCTHPAAMMHPGPTLMPSPMVAPYNARFVQLGTIGHGPQQYPIVQFAGGALPHFRPQRSRSDAQSSLPPLPPLATSAPPSNRPPPGSFVSALSKPVSSQQRSKRAQRLAKGKRSAAKGPALSDSTPMFAFPQLTPRCLDIGDVSGEPFEDDAAAFDPAELEALFNDDITIPLDMQEGGCESNVFGGATSSLGDLECGIPLQNDHAVRAHSAPDPFDFP